MPKESEITEEVLRDFIKFKEDFRYYAPRALKIQDPKLGLIDFNLHNVQKLVLDIIDDIRAKDRLVRIVILKARRQGMSTLITGRFYHLTSMNPSRYASCVTHEPPATDFLFKMIKRYHAKVPEILQPKTKANNSKLLEFNTDDGEGLDSAFRVGTAATDELGSGQLIHYLHLSEVAKYPKANQSSLLMSLLQCVPPTPDSEVFFESTAKGMGGEFYDRFWEARHQYMIYLDENKQPQFKCNINEKTPPESQFSSIFIPWFAFSAYRKPVPYGFKRTKEGDAHVDLYGVEEHLVELYGVDDEQLVWRRWCIVDQCLKSLDLFNQDYPGCPEDAFLTSGIPVFDNKKIKKLKDAAPPPIARYEVHPFSGQFVARDSGELRVWEEPKPGKCYIIGGDVSEGLPGKADFSVLDVIDHLSGDQVAQWHGKCEPGDLGRIMAHLGKRYNMAWVAPERNNHGYTTVTVLRDIKYPRIFMEIADDSSDRPRKRFGWVTSSRTRPTLIDTLIEQINDDGHGIKCADTFDEMLSFKKQDDGKMEADTGQHDDRVISIGIAKSVRKILPLPSQAMRNQPRESDFSMNKTSRESCGGSFSAFT